MTPDSELLAAFARTRSEADFAELVRRHVDLVYSAALRQVNGDAHLAQDVTQSVFADLAGKAGALAGRETLSPWLYTSTHHAAAKLVRSETRRRSREERFMREPMPDAAPDAEWENLRPLLDDAMHELKEDDRQAILLRYFENRPFAEVGAGLGLNENAARMRVERALEKLRAILARRGIATTGALAAAISAHAVQLAPAGLAAALATTSLAAAGGGTGALTLLKIMTATQIKIGLGALVVAGVAAALVAQHQTQQRLRSENEMLTQQFAQLQAGSADLSNRLAAAGTARPLADDAMTELLKLRGEVSVLRSQAAQLAKVREENQRLRARDLSPAQPTQLSPEDRFKLQEWHIIDTMKQVGLAMTIYSNDHNNVLVTNFDQITANKLYDTNQPGAIPLDNLEFMSVGLLSRDQPEMIMFREKSPRQRPDGIWEREYGLVDGSVQTINSDYFDEFEKQHSPPANQ